MASVPSAAAQVPHVQLEDPLQSYGKALSLQSLGQQNQMGQLQVAQAQQDQKDQINFREAFKAANGDPDKTVELAAKSGVGPKLLVPFQQSVLKHKQELLTYNEGQQKYAQAQADLKQGAYDAVDKAAPGDKPTVYQQQVGELKQMGVDVSQYPPQYPGDDTFKVLGAVLQGHKAMQDDAFKKAEQAKNQNQADLAATENKIKTQTAPSQVATAQADATIKGNEAANGGGIPVDQRALNDYLKDPSIDKGVAKNAATFTSWKAKQSPMAVVMGNQLGQGGQGSALDQAAERYSQTGDLPQGFSRSPGTIASIIKRSAELHPDQSIASNKATFAADSAALKKVQGTFDQVTAFENTALKNLDLYVEKAKAIPDIGVRFANVPLRAITKGMIGDANYAAMETARQTAATEAAKVLGSANASGVLSDSQKHEALDVLDGKLPLAATIKVVDTFKQDFANRHQGYADDIEAIKKRLNPNAKPQNAPAPAPGAFSWDKLPEHK